jgi:hypothetical protein
MPSFSSTTSGTERGVDVEPVGHHTPSRAPTGVAIEVTKM